MQTFKDSAEFFPKGLKTEESEAFYRYFARVQEEARKRNCTFFAFAGEGRDCTIGNMEGEDLTGWIIPDEKVDAFEKIWLNTFNLDLGEEFDDCFCWAVWNIDGEELTIDFKWF